VRGKLLLSMERKALPKYLGNSPLIEAIWQIRFDVNPSLAVGNLLPGILFTALEGNKKGYQLKQLPFADIPVAVSNTDENLKYQAKYRIEAQNLPYLYHIGEHMVSVNCRKPYEGWEAFKNKISELVGILQKAPFEFVNLRTSLRYINFLPKSIVPSISPWLRITLHVGDFSIDTTPLQIRAELPEAECTHVVIIINPAQLLVTHSNAENVGIIIDIDTVAHGKQNSLDGVIAQLDMLHQKNKALFFNEILTEDTINKLNPEYKGEIV
jgi:uncharacterized protein (TIGR04255 family)